MFAKIKNIISLYSFLRVQGILFLSTGILLAASQPHTVIRISADSLQMVLLANVNANYENCHCGEHPLGGLDRVITVIKQWRAKNPELVIADGGDFLNAYPYPALDRLVLNLYALIHPNIISLGDQELQIGNRNFQKKIFQYDFTVLNTNVIIDSLPELQKRLEIRLKTRQIDVLTYLDPSAFLWEKRAPNVHLSEAQFKSTYQKVRTDDAFRIAIFHGERDRLPDFIKRYPQFHLILLAHAQTQMYKNQHLPWILGPGTDSEYVTRLDLKFSENKKLPAIKLVRTPVELNIKTDPQARERIDQFLQISK